MGGARELSKQFKSLLHETLRAGCAVRFRAFGKSMHPTIRDGEVVIVRPVSPERIVVGDVILAETDRGMVAHRLIRVERAAARRGEPLLILRGDAQATETDTVTVSQVVGKVVAVERMERTIPVRSHTQLECALRRLALIAGRRVRAKRDQKITINNKIRLWKERLP
jgi:signal peptidase I